jgi:DNA-binding transcriptional MocR family regulator
MAQSSIDLGAMLFDWERGRGRKAERLAAALERALISGLFDGPLPAERRLARSLGISRGTVTAAYAQLKERRLISSRPGGYTRPDFENLRAPVQAARLAARGMAEGTILGSYVERNPRALDLSFAFLDVPEGTRKIVAHAYAQALDEPPSTSYLAAGTPELRERIAEWYTCALQLPTSPEQIVITQGAYQGIVLATLLALEPGDLVVAESPLYPGALDTLRAHGALIRPVASFNEPEVIKGLEREASNTKMIYATTVWRNPTGSLIDHDAALRLARLSARTDLTIIDDRALECCGFGTEIPAPLALHAPDAPILTLGSLDKTTGAGTRIGWIRAPRSLARKVARLKALSDLASPAFLQRVALRLFDHLETIAKARRSELRTRYEQVGALVRRYFPGWTWTEPTGGTSIWIDTRTDADALVRTAAAVGVTIIAGSAFSPNGISGSHVRLALSQPANIVDEALRRLASRIAGTDDSATAPRFGIP